MDSTSKRLPVGHIGRDADKYIPDIAVGDVLDMTRHACECYLLRVDNHEKECCVRWLIACVLAVSSAFATADGPVYAELQLAAGGVQNSELDFYPIFGSVSAGVFLVPGIGVEVFGDTSLRSDDAGAFNMDIEQAYGVAARFQSPPMHGIQGYIVLGAVNYTLDQDSQPSQAFTSSSVKRDFTGARVSVGLMQRLKSQPNLLVTFEYRHYNAGEPLRVDALALGLRLNTP